MWDFTACGEIGKGDLTSGSGTIRCHNPSSVSNLHIQVEQNMRPLHQLWWTREADTSLGTWGL